MGSKNVASNAPILREQDTKVNVLGPKLMSKNHHDGPRVSNTFANEDSFVFSKKQNLMLQENKKQEKILQSFTNKHRAQLSLKESTQNVFENKLGNGRWDWMDRGIVDSEKENGKDGFVFKRPTKHF